MLLVGSLHCQARWHYIGCSMSVKENVDSTLNTCFFCQWCNLCTGRCFILCHNFESNTFYFRRSRTKYCPLCPIEGCRVLRYILHKIKDCLPKVRHIIAGCLFRLTVTSLITDTRTASRNIHFHFDKRSVQSVVTLHVSFLSRCLLELSCPSREQ